MDIELNPTQILRVVKSNFKGKTYLDIRKYYWAETEWRPTTKGIAIPIHLAEKVLKAAQKELTSDTTGEEPS